MKVLVYGATGSQQAPVINALLTRGHQVRATTHSPDKLPLLQKKNVEAIVADMAQFSEVLQANNDIDAVSLLVPFLLPDPRDGFKLAKNAIDAAKATGVKMLVWNSSGFIPAVKTGNPAIDVRLEIQDYLQKSTVPFIIIQPSVYAENLLGPWTAPFVATENKVAYPTPEKMPIGWVATKDVAALVAQALERIDLAGSSFLVSGLENLTGTALAKKFSIGLAKPIDFYSMPPRKFGQILDSLFGEGAGQGVEAEYQKLWNTQEYPPMYAPMEQVLEKLPVNMTPMEVWVKENYRHFTADK